jgi:adenylate cyclase
MRRFIAGLTVATCVGVVICLAFWFNLLSGIQLQSSDFFFKAGDSRQNANLADKIVIIGIDDKSIEQLGHFPSWPRSYHAQLIDMLTEAKARVIVFDVLFSEQAPGDEEMAASIKRAGNVILPVTFVTTNVTGASESTKEGNFIRPISSFEESALAVGHANLPPDEDGVVRRVPLIISSDGTNEPALSLTVVAKYLRRSQVMDSPIESDRLLLAGRSIPLDDSNSMLINYLAGSSGAGATANFQTVSYVDVMRGQVDPNIFTDKIVIVGAIAVGLGDTFWTPMGHMVNGVDIHANAINTILTGDFLRTVPSIVTFALIVVLALVCGLLVLRLRFLWAMLSVTFIGIAYLLVAFFSFDKGFMLNMVYPPMAIVVSFVGVNLYSMTSERAERSAITKTFGRYMSKPVVDKILTALEKNELELGGEQCEVTVAFADIRGFTSMSENTPTAELVRLLNIYLSTVIEAVLKYDGMVNKFGGDSIMAVWNAPTQCKEHALMAIKAAMDAQRAIMALHQEDASLPKIDFSIGINTGKAMAGNFGSKDRLEYSVIGDAVNVAARLTGIAEAGKVWIGSDTYELVKDYIQAKPLEPFTVKGKREPIKAYEVVI